ARARPSPGCGRRRLPWSSAIQAASRTMASGCCVRRARAPTRTGGRAGFSGCPGRTVPVRARESLLSDSMVSSRSRWTFRSSARWSPISRGPQASRSEATESAIRGPRRGVNIFLSFGFGPSRSFGLWYHGAAFDFHVSRSFLTGPFRSEEDRAAWVAAIVDSSDDAIVSKTLDGLIMSWNRAAERIFGWTDAEVIGRPITILIPPERLHEEEDILARVRQGEKLDHFDTERIRKDGTRFEISLTVSPIRNAKGEIIGASKVVRDITERRRAEEARARLAAIVDSADDAIVSKTLEGAITSWNRAAEAMFGWTVGEAVGH